MADECQCSATSASLKRRSFEAGKSDARTDTARRDRFVAFCRRMRREIGPRWDLDSAEMIRPDPLTHTRRQAKKQPAAASVFDAPRRAKTTATKQE